MTEFTLSALRVHSFPWVPQSTIAIWLPPGALQSKGHACVGLHARCWPCLNHFPSRLLSSKVNRSVSRNLDRQWEPVSLSQVTNTAHITYTSVHLDLTRMHYSLWRELPCKHKGCSFILSLGLRQSDCLTNAPALVYKWYWSLLLPLKAGAGTLHF